MRQGDGHPFPRVISTGGHATDVGGKRVDEQELRSTRAAPARSRADISREARLRIRYIAFTIRSFVATNDVYRFLLRMPEELRARLAGSAEASGRSLNREIVHRLEESFQESETPLVALRGRGEGLMSRKYRRPAFALGLVAAVAVLLAVVAGVSNPPLIWTKAPKLNADPDAASSLKNRSLPGSVSREGSRRIVNDAAAQQLADRAYPGTTVPFSYRRGAASAFSTVSNRGPAIRGVDWQLAGPSTATYPAVLNRSNADYVASGRVTAMAIDPACTNGACRVWVAAAGGGVWRTDDGLAKTPDWHFVSGGFGTNAIGTLTFDAAHNVLYAGTGEPNASGDSEAGVGIYRSIDGGSTWALVPGSPAISSGNSIASIAVEQRGHALRRHDARRSRRFRQQRRRGARPERPEGRPLQVDGRRPELHARVRRQRSPPSTAGASTTSSSTATATSTSPPRTRASTARGRRHALGARLRGAGANDDFGRTEFALDTVNPGNHTRVYVGDGGDQTGRRHAGRRELLLDLRRLPCRQRRHGVCCAAHQRHGQPGLDVAHDVRPDAARLR